MPIEKIASWRDHSGQIFHSNEELLRVSRLFGIDIPPICCEINSNDFPLSIQDVYKFMAPFSSSNCILTDDASGGSEGLVMRTSDRKCIFKIKFKEYRRTLLNV